MPAEVASLLHARTASVRDEELEDLLDLSYGQDESAPRSALFQRLGRLGLAAEGLGEDDPVVVEKLRETGADYHWLVGNGLRAGQRTDGLVALLQRVNSRRKVTFQRYGQTTVIPEIGVARCLELTRRV